MFRHTNSLLRELPTKLFVWDKLQKPDFHAVVQTKNVFLSNKKLAELGYKPEISMEDTLMDIIDDYRGKE